jgi:hypothetical protein
MLTASQALNHQLVGLGLLPKPLKRRLYHVCHYYNNRYLHYLIISASLLSQFTWKALMQMFHRRGS